MKNILKIALIVVSFIFIFKHNIAANSNIANFFKEIVNANSNIYSVDAEIIQYIYTPEHSREVFKGRYRANRTGKFRIDYKTPFNQIVINNGFDLFWYYPDDRLLYIVGENSSLKTGPKINPLQEFITEKFDKRFNVRYLGKHLYGFFQMAHQFIVKDSVSGLTIDAWVDVNKKALLAKIVRNADGIEILKKLYSNFKKIKSVYFPLRVDVFSRTEMGITKNTTEYSNVRINYSMSEKVFNIKFPKNITRKYLNGRQSN